MAPTLGFCLFDTAIGFCAIAWSERALVGVQLPEVDAAASRLRMRRRFPQATENAPTPWVQAALTRIRALLAGRHDDLRDIPLDMSGVPPFNRRVYEIARGLPPGRTVSYGEVAALLGEPAAARAVGQALGHNPFAPVVPCHRVIAASGAAGGFSADGGVATKLRMLQIERAQFGPQPGLFDSS